MVSLDSARSKRDLRQHFKSRLSGFLQESSAPKAELDAALVRWVSTLIEEPKGCAALFRGMDSEPVLEGLRARHPQWKWAYPALDGDRLKFYVPHSEGAFRAGAFNIQEPDPSQSRPINLSECDVVCVPGLAFDGEGRRLGRGKGYYDRTLQTFKGKKIGVGYTAQISDEPLPAESHDVAVDYVVTEHFLLQPKG